MVEPAQDGKDGWGYGAFILPQLHQASLFNELAPNRTSRDGPAVDQSLVSTRLPVFECPAVLEETAGRSNYKGSAELFAYEAPLEDVYDGESTTLMLGESVALHRWADPGTGTCTSGPNQGDFGSPHSGGANFLMCDGAVYFIADHVDIATFQALSTLAGREVVGDF
ncbi:MAG: DUF1559 domain-containing protein [Planctomycetaceae bacterium]